MLPIEIILFINSILDSSLHKWNKVFSFERTRIYYAAISKKKNAQTIELWSAIKVVFFVIDKVFLCGVSVNIF